MNPSVVIVGRLTKDPDLRFVPVKDTTKTVANFTVVTSRSVERNGKWTDEDVTYWECTAWDKLAENVCESLVKGDPVIVVGKAHNAAFKGRDGEERRALKVNADSVGPDLKKNVARVDRGAVRTSGPVGADEWSTSSDPAPF